MATEINTTQRVAPFLYYDDVGAALDWLCVAFGCEERFRLAAPNGVVHHAELAFGDGVVLVGNVGPRNSGALPTSVRSGVYVFVDDVDAHCASARQAGAQIVSEPVELPFGDRMYLALDHEGHEWYFAQHVRDVSLAELNSS
jgi:PhnB protein